MNFILFHFTFIKSKPKIKFIKFERHNYGPTVRDKLTSRLHSCCILRPMGLSTRKRFFIVHLSCIFQCSHFHLSPIRVRSSEDVYATVATALVIISNGHISTTGHPNKLRDRFYYRVFVFWLGVSVIDGSNGATSGWKALYEKDAYLVPTVTLRTVRRVRRERETWTK